MVCIAAFIILAIIGIFVAIISIFKREVGKKYLQMLKKSWGCLGKKIRLQKCETGFKEDVKNTLLSRVIIKHPTWIKPLSVIIEVVSVIIVVVAVWALLTAIKSLLALWTLGTCNVTKPAACSLGAEVCSIDESEPSNIFEATGRWFEEWGEIFAAIPDKFRNYDADSFDFYTIEISSNDQPTAIDIVDPGCSVCLRSYRNQKTSGFFDQYHTKIVFFAIQNPDGSYKFKNSELLVRTAIALNEIKSELAAKFIDAIFTGKSSDEKYENQSYQGIFNEVSSEEAERIINQIFGIIELSKTDYGTVKNTIYSDRVTEIMNKNKAIVENEIHAKGIPTMLYDGVKHTGLYKLPEWKCFIYNIFRPTTVFSVENIQRKILTWFWPRYNIILILYFRQDARWCLNYQKNK